MAAQKTPQESAAKKKRGRPVGSTHAAKYADTPHRAPYGPSKDLQCVQAKKPMLPAVYNAFGYLPYKIQDKLLKEYGEFVCLVDQKVYDRVFKAYSEGREVSQMPEIIVKAMLDDAIEATRDNFTKWVFQDQIGVIAGELTDITSATGEDISTLDKVEFFAITLSMTTNLLSKYLTVLTREGVIEKGLEPATVDAIANATIAMDALIKDGIFNRVGAAWKARGGIKGSQDTTRKKTNMAKVVDNMENLEESIEFFAKDLAKKQAKLLSKIHRTITVAHDATRAKSPRGRKPKAK